MLGKIYMKEREKESLLAMDRRLEGENRAREAKIRKFEQVLSAKLSNHYN